MQPTIATEQPPIIATIGTHANHGSDWHSFQNSLIILPLYKFDFHNQFPDRLSNLSRIIKISDLISKMPKPPLHRREKKL